MEKLNQIKYMSRKHTVLSCLLLLLLLFPDSALAKKKKVKTLPATTTYHGARDSVKRKVVPIDILDANEQNTSVAISDSNIDNIVALAQKQLGMSYIYGSANPKNGGFDCSGFVYYVMTTFNYKVPRTSKDYMNFGTTIAKENAQKGDVILFTGTDASTRVGGHVGIVLENTNGDITFIHSSSGKGKGVTMSKLSEGYYTQRFLKVIRVVK